MTAPELAGWLLATTTLTGVIAFLYQLLKRSQAREDAAVEREQQTAARIEGNTEALRALTDVLGARGSGGDPGRSRGRARTEG